MGDKSSAPKAPSYDKVNKANKKANKAAQKQAKDHDKRGDKQYQDLKAQVQEDRKTTDQVTQRQLDLMDDSSEYAAKDRERYEQVFQPLENDLVKEAMDYSTPERRDLEMGRAQAETAHKFEQQRSAAERQLEGYGINPSATRYAALDLGVRLEQAAATAAAGNQAYQDVENTRRALRTEAIGIGQKIPDRAIEEQKTAANIGSAANANTIAATKNEADVLGTPVEYGQLSNQALNTQAGAGAATANATNAAYGNQVEAYNAEESNKTDWGELAGTALGAGAKMYTGGLPKAAAGGAIPGPTPGGAVPAGLSPSGGKALDDVNAKLTAGEFVIPDDVTKWKGEEFFQKLIEKAREQKKGAKAKPTMGGIPTPGAPAFTSRPGALPTR